MQRHINTLLFRKRPTRGQPPPMAGRVSGQPRSPGDVRVRTGDTVYKAGCHGSARFLASLGRPGMYGATGPCPLDDALMRFDEVHEIRLKRGCKFDLFV